MTGDYEQKNFFFDLARLSSVFCHYIGMTIKSDITLTSDGLDHIRNAVANATKKVPHAMKGLLDELKAEALAEKLVVEHGVLNASKQDINDEFVSLDAVESDKGEDDFDNDENLVDMDGVSPEMLDAFGE